MPWQWKRRGSGDRRLPGVCSPCHWWNPAPLSVQCLSARPAPVLWRKLAMFSVCAPPNWKYRRQPKQRADCMSPTEEASRLYVASLFFGQAGLEEEAGQARAAALRYVEKAVRIGTRGGERQVPAAWRYGEVIVEGPARIDLGGGWSDTPPFCLDWGGTVLNIAISPNDAYPISTIVRRLPQPVIRCVSGEDSAQETYTTIEQVLAPPRPGCPFSIPRVTLQMSGLFPPGEPLSKVLARLGGGLEIQTT